MEKTPLGHAIGMRQEWVQYEKDGVDRAYTITRHSRNPENLAADYCSEIRKTGIEGVDVIAIPRVGVVIDAPIALLKEHGVFNEERKGELDKASAIIKEILCENRLWLPQKSWQVEEMQSPDSRFYEAWFAGKSAELLLEYNDPHLKNHLPSLAIEQSDKAKYIAEHAVEENDTVFAKAILSEADLKQIGILDYIGHLQGILTRLHLDRRAGGFGLPDL